ncbi:inovirus-type Gp2 protein [Shewanella sp. KX20019]|uniref:YagK/YfjJ domain-containing protein n=1 Tax=Shewanella sp. KX20019 TaxID=2803864 RepID=UPI00192569AE|nr:inovirus-type Gp2 protein [Shewanella sp. KX20019]QQX79999.1 inovirus-type Gp2 protein [Shewanella sp. KX20019]
MMSIKTKQRNLYKPFAKSSKRFFCINQHNSSLAAYKDHAYHVFKPKQKSLNKKMVNTIISDYEIMLSHYSRVFVVRIELHPNTYSADNKVIRLFLERLITFLSGEYESKVIYHCAREQETSDLEHYHLELMLSAHKINHSNRILSLVKAMWEMHANGTVSFVDNPFCIVHRGNKTSLKHAIYRSSYLAKEHTKELNGNAKGFLSNKLPPAKTFDPTNDLMLVDPYITLEINRRKQAFEVTQTTESESRTKTSKSSKYAWFNTKPHSQRLKECIASKTTSLNHLTTPSSTIQNRQTYRYKNALVNELSEDVITIKSNSDHSSSTP